jgi:PTS system ascorbate-specific IIA component
VSVHLILVTHGAIGASLLEEARGIVGQAMDEVRLFPVFQERSAKRHEALRADLRAALEEDDDGDGVLLLVDLPGATPSNLALGAIGDHGKVVSGLNLPMLVRAWNYRDRPLDELVELAIDGGRRAITEPLRCCGGK